MEALYANWKVWPVAQLANFYVVPPNYRVLVVNTVGLFWNVILSFIAHKH